MACAGLAAAFLFSSAPARAQGFGLYEQGSCMMGRAGAGVAAPCDDGSSVFFNPAGLALDTGTVASAGLTGIAPRGTFTDSTTSLVSTLNKKTFPAPSAYFATRVGSRAVVGIGVFAPYGLTSDWPNTSEGRFLGYKSSVHSLYVQPTFAARVSDRVSIGAGIDITHTSLELHKRVDLATLPIPGAPAGLTFGALGVPAGTDFADVGLNGSGVRVGAHLGVIVKANDTVSFGARYMTRQRVAIDKATVAATQVPTGLALRAPLPGLPVGTPLDLIVGPAFRTGAALGAQTASTSLPLPDQLVLGVAIHASSRLTLLADYQFTDWSLFDRIVIDYQFAPQTVLVESHRDTHGARIGAEYAIGRATIRGGFDGHTASAPDQSVTPLLPEAPRTEYAAGASLPVAGNVRLDLAYMYVNQSDRNGRTTDGGLAVPTVAVNNGLYHYYANLYSASVVVRF